IELGQIVIDLVPARLGAYKDMKGRLDAGRIDQRAHGDMGISVLGDVGIEQRTASATVKITASFGLAIEQQIRLAPNETHPIMGKGSHRLEGRAGCPAATGAMAVKCSGKGVF